MGQGTLGHPQPAQRAGQNYLGSLANLQLSWIGFGSSSLIKSSSAVPLSSPPCSYAVSYAVSYSVSYAVSYALSYAVSVGAMLLELCCWSYAA